MSILDRCSVDDVVAVCYGNDPHERVCRVVNIRDMDKHPLSPKSIANRPHVARSQRLVTCRDTKGQVRAFYAGCEHASRTVPKLRAGWLYLRGKLPKRKGVACDTK
jgi:hypothetical protein